MPVSEVDLGALPTPGLLIGGELLTASTGESHPHRYAATGKLTYEVPLAGAKEIDAAVSAARAAAPVWKKTAPDTRRRLMLDYAAELRRRTPELKRLVTAENGTPIIFCDYYPAWVAELFEFNAGYTDKIGGQVVTTWPAPAFDYTLDEPYGVIAVIVPWNGPFVSFGQMLAPALAAGNTIVLKPPELAPFSSLALGAIAQDVGFPPGVINVVPGGPLAGDALVRHPGVDKIFFTGSGGTAKKIQAAAAESLTPACFELGGKSPRVIFADADLDQAAQLAINAAISLSGQACIAGTRVIVEDSVYGDVVASMKQIAEATAIGDPQDPRVIMGPVISQTAVDRIMGYIDRARSETSATLVTGGARLAGDLADGYFIAPTIFADADNSEEVTREEIFGPIVSVLRFKTEDEAIALANDTEYGLAAHLDTTDLRRAHRVSAALDAGTIWVNGFYDLPVGAPFGGVKSSGNGRVGGIYAIQEFTRPKNVWMAL